MQMKYKRRILFNSTPFVQDGQCIYIQLPSTSKKGALLGKEHPKNPVGKENQKEACKASLPIDLLCCDYTAGMLLCRRQQLPYTATFYVRTASPSLVRTYIQNRIHNVGIPCRVSTAIHVRPPWSCWYGMVCPPHPQAGRSIPRAPPPLTIHG